MYSITDLKNNTLIELNSEPYQVLEYHHTQLGRGGAVVKTRLKNLLTGSVVSKTFKGHEKIEPANVTKNDMQYLYQEAQNLVLMDMKSFDQVSVNKDIIADKAEFLNEGDSVVALFFNNNIIDLDIPNKIISKVIHTEPAVKGDTATTALKPAKISSGKIIQVPLFIKTGDNITVDTRNGAYIGRA